MSEKPDLEQLQERHDALRLKLESAEMERSLAVLESSALPGTPIPEAWNDLVDPLGYLQDDVSFGKPRWTYGATLGDRRDGRNPPVFQTEEELAAIRAVARVLVDISPNARCALRNLTNYIISTGLDYKVTASKVTTSDEDSPGVADGLIETAEAVVQDFLENSNWVGRREREVFGRSERDGECFLHLSHIGGGLSRVRFVEPEQISDPGVMPEFGQNWAFGINTDAEDIETVYGYWVKWNDVDGPEHIPADRMVHLKRNTDTGIKRGLSGFYAVYAYLEDAAKLLRNTVRGAAVLAAIAMIRKHVQGVTEGQIETMRSGNAYRQYTQQTATEGSRTRYQHKYEPGSIVDVPKGMDYEASPLANQGVGTACVTIEQAVLRVIGCNWCMPEYLISGDASNANYSSTMVAESPWVKNCQAEQSFYIGDFQDLLWKVLKIAYVNQRFSRFNVPWHVLRRVVALEITPPDVAVRDRDKETERRKKLREEGILSAQTFAAEEGYDLEQEQTQGAKRQEPMGFGFGGQEEENPEKDPNDPRQQRGNRPARRVGNRRQFESRLYESYNEAEHPRDDRGRWIDKAEIAAARADPQKAAELRAEVTDPEEVDKLDRAIETKVVATRTRSYEALAERAQGAARAVMQGNAFYYSSSSGTRAHSGVAEVELERLNDQAAAAHFAAADAPDSQNRQYHLDQAKQYAETAKYHREQRKPLQSLRTDAPRSTETASEYMDRMLGKRGSVARKVGDPAAYKRYLQIWDHYHRVPEVELEWKRQASATESRDRRYTQAAHLLWEGYP